MKTPNQTYYAYQSPTSTIVPSSSRKTDDKLYSMGHIPMYNSVATPNSTIPSVASGIRVLSGASRFPKSSQGSPPQRPIHQNLNQTAVDMHELYISSTTMHKHQTEIEVWRAKDMVNKMKILDARNKLIVKDSLLNCLQSAVLGEQRLQNSIPQLTADLQSAQQQICHLKEKLQHSKEQDKELKSKQEYIKKQKTLIQELQNKELSDLYQTNLPQMNKDKEFYVFKLIECENTLRQRDLKIAELEKIQKIIIKEMDDVKNKPQVDKSQDVRKYLEREEELIGNITKFKVDANARDTQLKQLTMNHSEEIEQVRRQENATRTILQARINEGEVQNVKLTDKIRQLQAKIGKAELGAFPQSNPERQKETQHEYELLESKLLAVLKQMQMTNYEYEQYKHAMQQEIDSLTQGNQKMGQEVKLMREQLQSQVSENSNQSLLAQHQQFKKSADHREKTLTSINLSMGRRQSQLEADIKILNHSLDLTKQMHNKQLLQMASKSLKPIRTDGPTDIETATLKSVNQQLTERIKQLQSRVVEYGFNSKVVENLETENKYIKETVRIQTAEISFLKKQHLEVIQSMINLNHKKSIQDSAPKTLKFAELVVLLDKYDKTHLQSGVVDYMEMFETLNKVFDNRYTFLKTKTSPEFGNASPRHYGLNVGMSPDAHQQSSYQEEVTVFYQQHFKGLLMLFDLEEGDGCEAELNQKIKEMMNNSFRFAEEIKEIQQINHSLESKLKQSAQELEKKTKTLDELGKHAAKLESNVSVAVEKLIKYQQLLDEANRDILDNQLLVLASKQQLSSLKESSKADREDSIKQIRCLQQYLKQMLRVTSQSEANLQNRTPQFSGKSDIVLYKLFLRQASEDNLHLNDLMSKIQAGLISDQTIRGKCAALWDIKQYYKGVLIAEVLKGVSKQNTL